MFDRHLPVRPDLDQLKHQAKELLRAARRGDAAAVALLREHHPRAVDPAAAKLADAQVALARFYGVPSWTRLALACRITAAIWRGDVAAVRDLVVRHPQLLREDARGAKSNWGPPMSYAANLGRDEIVTTLRELGAEDVQYAFERAALQGRIQTARQLVQMGARPMRGSVMGPCETLNADGLTFLLDSGAELANEHGDPLAPVALLLQTYSRGPEQKHRCLEIVSRHGIALPDTPVMAFHRGRIELLEPHLRADPQLFSRTWSHHDIYPPELGCSGDESLALHGTPLAGTTLLHLAVDFDEIGIARWMIERGADVDVPARRGDDGFGGHTALFGCVVSQAYRCGRQADGTFARLLLDHGADPNARASLRKRLRFTSDQTMHEYRNVTPLSWGERFHDRDWVNQSAMSIIAGRGGCH